MSIADSIYVNAPDWPEPQIRKHGKWTIDKQFDFCYGHRVYVQKLNSIFTQEGHTQAKCRHLHGHQGKVHVYLEGERLNDQSMVEDFVHLGWLKDFIDETLDHKFIIDKNDPMFKQLVVDVWKTHSIDTASFLYDKCIFSDDMTTCVGQVVNVAPIKDTSDKEVLGGYFIVNFVPTSELLAKWLFDIVRFKMPHVNVTRVDWWETPKSRSSYSE